MGGGCTFSSNPTAPRGWRFKYRIDGREGRPGRHLRGHCPRVAGAAGTQARGGELLRAIDGYRGSLVTSYALKLAPLTFVRPGELRQSTWSEFYLDEADGASPPSA